MGHPRALWLFRTLKLEQLLLLATTNALFPGVSGFLKGRTSPVAWFFCVQFCHFLLGGVVHPSLRKPLLNYSRQLSSLLPRNFHSLSPSRRLFRNNYVYERPGQLPNPRVPDAPLKPKAGLNGSPACSVNHHPQKSQTRIPV